MGRIKSVKNFINLLYINFCNILSILKNTELKVNEIYELSSSTKDAQIKGAKQLEDVNESIKFINEKFEEYEADRKKKEKEIAELKEDLTSLKEKFF